MRNLVKAVIAVGMVIVLFLLIKSFYIEADITLKDDKLNWIVKYKGIKNAVDFTVDKQGGFYIAYIDKIQYIENNGKSYDILKDKSLNIKSLDYKEQKLYFLSGNKVVSYDLDRKEDETLLYNIPNYGDYRDGLLRIKGDELYISIGAATNSGVVGSDNRWIIDNPFYHDIPAKDITIKGTNFGNEKSGAFIPYRSKNIAGQLISGHFPGNASIIQYSLTSRTAETYAWGIRNVKGMCFNSEGNLMAAVGGMEDRGLRPVKGDVDYIYEIKKNLWHGWPDYSGGDPVTSPRFKGENNTRLSFILDNHPTTNPPAPIYIHKSLSTLGAIDVDVKGLISGKDCIYFYDTRDNMIYGLTKAGILSEKVLFNEESKIASLKVMSNSIFALDSAEGVLYSINTNKLERFINLSRPVMYYLIIVMLIGIVIIVWMFNINKKK